MKDILKEIYLRQNFTLMLPEATNAEPDEKTRQLAATVAVNFAQLNMVMPVSTVEKLSRCSEKDIVEFYDFYLPILEDMIGKDFENRRLFFPGFPKEVIEKDKIDIFFDQVCYALTGFSTMPESKPEMTYLPYIWGGFKKELSIGSEKDFAKFVEGLINSPTVWSENQKEAVNALFDNYPNFENLLPAEPSKIKENNIYLLQLIKDKLPERFDMYATKYLKTPTDVMRWAVTYVNGDISLNGKLQPVTIGEGWRERTVTPGFSFSRNPKFKEATRSLSRSEINEILTLLSNTRMDLSKDYPEILEKLKENARLEGRNDDFILVDDYIQAHRQYYKSLAKVAHLNPEKAETQVEKVLAAVCSNKIRTINSVIEKAIKDKNINEALFYLKYRPTELTKRIDKLCQIASETGETKLLLDVYKDIAKKSSIGSLLQLHGQIESRKIEQEARTIIAKGKITQKEPKKALSEGLCNDIQNILVEALKEKYKDTPYLGKVYIDKSMFNVKIPKNDEVRSASEKLYPYTFASTLPNIKETKTKQFAVKWEDGNQTDKFERIDIDLSATGINKDGTFTNVGWNTGYAENGIVYSGDIQKGGAAEFINVDLNEAKESGLTAIAFNVNIYCGAASYKDMLDCQFIMCERNDMEYGNTYEPKTVRMSIKPQANSKFVTPLVLDLERGQWIWVDYAEELDNDEIHSIASQKTENINTIIKNAIFASRYNPGFDVLLAAQNCDIVDDPKEADIIFTQEDKFIPGLKENAQVITQNDYNKLVKFLDETRRDEIEKEEEVL